MEQVSMKPVSVEQTAMHFTGDAEHNFDIKSGEGFSSKTRSMFSHGARSAADFFNGLAHHSIGRRITNDIVARLRAECRHIQEERAAAFTGNSSLQQN